MQLQRVEIDVSHEGKVARISLPGGPLDTETARELAAAADHLIELTHTDAGHVRVIVLDARTSPFCSGPAADLDRFEVNPAAALSRLRQPIICAVDGICSSVGLEVLLATDIRLCSPEATFSLPDVLNGQLPAWGGTQRLARAIRPAEAVAMTLTGSSLDAGRAVSLGLVHATSDDLPAEVDAMVETLIGMAPFALELTKEAVHRGSELPLRDGLRLEGDLNHQLAATEDRAVGLQAFFDKRPPDFSGR